METTVLIQFVAKPSEADAFAELLTASAINRSKDPGTTRVVAFRDKNAPWRFTLTEVFVSQEAIDRYYASPTHQEWESVVQPLLVETTGDDQIVLTDWCSVRGLRVPGHETAEEVSE